MKEGKKDQVQVQGQGQDQIPIKKCTFVHFFIQFSTISELCIFYTFSHFISCENAHY